MERAPDGHKPSVKILLIKHEIYEGRKTFTPSRLKIYPCQNWLENITVFTWFCFKIRGCCFGLRSA